MYELEFRGAARTVTGSCHILRMNGKTILLEPLFWLYEKCKHSRSLDPILGNVPMAILYNTDTTGGKSGRDPDDQVGIHRHTLNTGSCRMCHSRGSGNL